MIWPTSYHIRIKLLNTEENAPWASWLEPYPLGVCANDEEAIAWAQVQKDGLIGYEVRLYDDTRAIAIPKVAE